MINTQNELGLHVHDAKDWFSNCSVNGSNDELNTYFFPKTFANNANMHADDERKLPHEAKAYPKDLEVLSWENLLNGLIKDMLTIRSLYRKTPE